MVVLVNITSIQFLQMSGDIGIYPQARRFLRLRHHHQHHPIHSSYEKSIIIESTMQYIKDRTEYFDDYYPCRKKNCKLLYVRNWLNLFIGYQYKQLQIVK
jgi:putative transposase